MPTLPEFNLDGKVAIVTGAAQGIGKGIAKSLARAGADIVIAGISLGDRENDDKAMQSAAAEIAEMGTKVLPITADLRNLDEVENLMSQTLDQFGGKLDIMVNNAGSSPGGIIETLTEDDWAQSRQLKFMGYVRCLRYVLPIMVGQGGGRGRQSDR